MNNPSKPLRVLCIGTVPAARATPTCDPALDLDAPGVTAALSRYERERSDEARDAIPLRAGMRPALFTLAPLTARALATIEATPSGEVNEALTTLSIACHHYTDAQGVDHHARDLGEVRNVAKGFSVASDDWTEHLFETFGSKQLVELAKVARDRAHARPGALDPFALPRGLTLPR